MSAPKSDPPPEAYYFAPEWLQIAVNYYPNTGKNFRFELFNHIATKSPKLIDEAQIRITKVILSLFQLSILMLDDIFDKSMTRRGVKCMHFEHGTTLVSTWAIGITHFIYQLSEEYFGDKKLAIDFNRLYNEIGIRTLRGQCLELLCKDYEHIVRYKTGYYTVGFPVAIAMLLRTKDLTKAMRIMEDPELRQLGFLFQSENDFLGVFEPDNTDIEMKSWTMLVDMMAKRDPGFVYPKTRKEAEELYKKHDIYNEYVKFRERELHLLRMEAGRLKICYLNLEGDDLHRFPGLPGRDPDELTCKYLAIQYCLEFFESYKYQGELPTGPMPSYVPVDEE